MKILHSSDIHGKYKKLINGHADTDFDVWLDTGDFLDNVGRRNRTGMTILPEAERIYQRKLLRWKDLPNRFTKWLNGRPAILVPGNHDFLYFGLALQKVGCNVHMITPEGVEVLGYKWAGFRQIPYYAGEWAGEIQQADFKPLVEETLQSNPDFLVTHAPPAGIMDGTHGYGIKPLSSALTYREHNIKAHFFGHEHSTGGQTEEHMGVQFINGACNVKLHQF